MKNSLGLFLVLTTLAIIHNVRAQDQQGFISLDCGLPANELSTYKEETKTGLWFSSDAKYIQSGKGGRVQADLETRFLKPHKTLRYFPEGIRNCYNLNVTKGKTHLIRAVFVYGNYDGRDSSPKFDLYLGPIYGPRFVNTWMSTPVISSLQIRSMRDDTYITQSDSLKLFFRRYLRKSENYLRYPDDVYDRQWDVYFQKEWTQIYNSRDVGHSNIYDPPKKALTTAAIPTNASEPLTIEWTNSNNPTAQYYLYAYYAEIQELRANDTRIFNMVWNGKSWSPGKIPIKFEIRTTQSNSPGTCQGGKCSFQLIKTNGSTLPPLLNALEVYTVIQFLQSATDESDVDAMKNIATTYELSRINWQGDPCFPLRLRWDGINCSNPHHQESLLLLKETQGFVSLIHVENHLRRKFFCQLLHQLLLQPLSSLYLFLYSEKKSQR